MCEDDEFFWRFALVLLNTWPLATAISYIMLGRHYILDVAVGVIFGHLQGAFVSYMLFVPGGFSQSLHHWIVYNCYMCFAMQKWS